MDESIDVVVSALHKKGMLDNTIILFLSDNGGQVNQDSGFGSNYPLRGNKNTFWEGAIRIPAYIWSPLLNLTKPRVSNQLMHVSDWLPSLISMLGGSVSDLGTIDGYDMWQTLIDDTPSPRTDMLQNLDPINANSAYRQGDMKLTNGSSPNSYVYWYGPSRLENFNGSTTYEWVFKRGSVVRDILKEKGLWIVEDPDDAYQSLLLTCEQPPPQEAYQCQPSVKPCLFNITADPCEYYDISDQYPDTVDEMWKILLKYESEQMQPQNEDCDPSGNPMCFDFQYVTWLEPDQHQDCNL